MNNMKKFIANVIGDKKKEKKEPMEVGAELIIGNVHATKTETIVAGSDKEKEKKKKKTKPWFPTEPSLLEPIPRELKVEVLKFLSPHDLARVACLSHHWKTLVDDDFVWKERCKEILYRSDYSDADVEKILKETKDRIKSEPRKGDFVTMKDVYKDLAFDNEWDTKFAKQDIKVSLNGKRAEHTGGSCTYRAVRTNRGFTRGRHYWEVTIVDASVRGYNVYIGISVRDFRQDYRVGSTGSLGIRGLDGRLYYDSKEINYTSEQFDIGIVVGVLLDMDNHTICWFLRGEEQQTVKLNGIGPNREVFPAVSFINPNEIAEINFCAPIPKRDPTKGTPTMEIQVPDFA